MVIARYKKGCSIGLAGLSEDTGERQTIVARPFIVAVDQGIGWFEVRDLRGRINLSCGIC
tara:strand:+ start:416 stop:595 length:180 start_codon:yes stop_codon:yes gene_type:complete